MKTIKILLSGFPCTKFSIAQHNNRETKPFEGEGWELFANTLYARDKFEPDIILMENNASISQNIKDAISDRIGFTYVPINSALVSAQTRKRIYWVGKKNFDGTYTSVDIPTPNDKGILLKDILEYGAVEQEKTYCLCTDHMKANRDYAKKTGVRVELAPVGVAKRGRYGDGGKIEQHYEARSDGKSNCVTTVQKDCLIAEPVRVGDIGSNSQANRVYSCIGKSVNLVANGGGAGAKTGLYFTPIPNELKGLVCDKGRVYNIADGCIETNVGRYKCNMPDGLYVIRKLTVKEAERLQTLDDGYVSDVAGVSNQQKYKSIGNGWTADVIIHILHQTLKDVSRDARLEVLSLYDGIGTGLYCLKKMGFTNIVYKACEIDKNAITICRANHSDVIEIGDAFQIRDDNWRYENA